MSLQPQDISEMLIGLRGHFLEAAQKSGGRLDLFPSNRSVDGPNVSCDIVRLGAPSAESELILINNTPGKTGFHVSKLFTSLLTRRLQKHLARDCCLTLVHALNPVGEVWPEPFRESDAPPPFVDTGDKIDWTQSLLKAADQRYANFKKMDEEDPEHARIGRAATSPWGIRLLNRLARVTVEKRATIRLLEIHLTHGATPARFHPFETNTAPTFGLHRARSFAATLAEAPPFEDTPIGLSGPVSAFNDAAEFGTFDAALLAAGVEDETLTPAFDQAVVKAMQEPAQSLRNKKRRSTDLWRF